MQIITITEQQPDISILISKLKSLGQDIYLEQKGKMVAKISQIDDADFKKRLGAFEGLAEIPDDFKKWSGELQKFWE
jgi:hypothetical protein